MRQLKVLELFSGTECISNAFRKRGGMSVIQWTGMNNFLVHGT